MTLGDRREKLISVLNEKDSSSLEDDCAHWILWQRGYLVIDQGPKTETWTGLVPTSLGPDATVSHWYGEIWDLTRDLKLETSLFQDIPLSYFPTTLQSKATIPLHSANSSYHTHAMTINDEHHIMQHGWCGEKEIEKERSLKQNVHLFWQWLTKPDCGVFCSSIKH